MRAIKRLNFTIAALTAIKIPDKAEKKAIYYDIKQHGLALIVSYGGSKTFYLYTSHNLRMHILKIGRFPDIDIDYARSKVLEYKRDLQNNINPKEEKDKIRHDKTLREFFENDYLIKHAKVRKKQASWKQDIGIFNNYFKPVERKTMLSITRDNIENLHRDVGNNIGVYAANRCLSLIKHMFNMAIGWGFTGANPALHIKKFREKARDRFLQPEELQRFFNALDSEPDGDYKDFISLLLFTGQRLSNIISLKWDYIDFVNKTMFLPDTKNHESQHIPLTEQAVKVFNRIKERRNEYSDWVFPNKNTRSGHLEPPRHFWAELLNKTKIKNLRLHDLRRTMGSYQAIMGSSLHIIGKSLGHKSQQTTAIYARLNLEPVRESMQKAANAMGNYI
jgi:integrase